MPEDVVSVTSSDQSQRAHSGAPSCTLKRSTKVAPFCHMPLTPMMKLATRTTTSLTRGKSAEVVGSPLRVYCIPPPSRSYCTAVPHRAKSAVCSTQKQCSSDVPYHPVRQQGRPEQESFDEVSLLLDDHSINSSWDNWCVHNDDSLDIPFRKTTNDLSKKQKDTHNCNCSQIGVPNRVSYTTSCTVRDFGIREYFRRRVINNGVRQFGDNPPNSSIGSTNTHKAHLINPLRVTLSRYSKVTARPGIIYEHVPRNLPAIHLDNISSSEFSQQRFLVDQPNSNDHIPFALATGIPSTDPKQVFPEHMKHAELKLSSPHRQSIKSPLDKSMNMATLFASLPDMSYSRSNLTQQERVTRIFGPQTISKGRTRTIKDIIMSNSQPVHSDNLSLSTEVGPPAPPDGPPSLSSSRRKKLTYSLSNTAQQRSQVSNYTHFESRSRSSPLQDKDFSVDSIYGLLQQYKSQHNQNLESPLHNLHMSTKSNNSLDKVLSPFSLSKQANRAISVPIKWTAQNNEANLSSSLPLHIDISVDHPERLLQCLDLLSEETTPLAEDPGQKPHSCTYNKDTIPFVQEITSEVVQEDGLRSLVTARNSIKRPPRTYHKRHALLLPSETNSDDSNFDLLAGDNAIMLTDTSDTTQVVPSSDCLSDTQIGYGVSAEFRSPDKDRLLPQTPRNETVKLNSIEVEKEPTGRFSRMVNTEIVGSHIGSLALPNASIISTPTQSVGPSFVHSSRHSTPSILPPTAALESIRNSNYAPYAATGAHIMRASTTGHIYFRSSTPTEQDKVSFNQYIMHPERHRMRSTLASNNKVSDLDRTSIWSSRTSDTSMSYADYKSSARGTLTVPRLPRYLRYNEFYLERMAEYGHAPVDTSDMDYTGSSHQQRSGSESDEHSSIADLSWNTQYYLMNPSSHNKLTEEIYRLASKRPNNVLKKFLEEKRIMTRRRARFRFEIICIVAKVQTQTAPDGTISKRVIFDVC
ncbi:Hypothetical protein GLP15_1056 [Giardia lamblia P15]|uniref:Uncharacterized protein n=1 Tax=Giardia intestinalis (strain P15) TaxID=658858 RepID=E1F2Y1_GIAIA|nr:Hypothetical protein GLP15_1056 [Giardia lamblia P15]